MRDVADLANASAQLVEVANTINRANPVWANAAVQVLIAVNQVIERLQQKGAATYARYLEKHGMPAAPGEPYPAHPLDEEAVEEDRALKEEED